MKDIQQADFLQAVQVGLGQIWVNYGYQTKLKFTAVVLEVTYVRQQVFGFLKQAYLFNSLGSQITVNIELRKIHQVDAATGGCRPLLLAAPRACAMSPTTVVPTTLRLLMPLFMCRCASVFNLIKSCMRTLLVSALLGERKYEFST